MENLKEYVELLVKKNQNEESVNRVVGLISKPAVQKGENFTTLLLRYELKVLLGTGETATKNLIVKTLPSSEDQCKFIISECYFKNEIQAYKIMRKLKALMEEFNDRRDTLWCEMIGFKPYNEIILQDLTDLQFYPMDRRKTLDWEHSIFVLKSLARCHAMSAVLIKKSIIRPGQLEPYMFAKQKTWELLFGRCMNVMHIAVRDYWGKDWIQLADLLKQACKVMYVVLQKYSKIDETKFNVVNLGDTWINNFLFKHIEGTDIPCHLKFIDFQMSHYNTYAWDITYFIITSLLPKFRRENYNEILTIYQKSLSENLKFFGYPENEIPTLQMVIDEMERIKFYGFALLCSVYPWITADCDDPYDMEKALLNMDKPYIGVNIDIFNSKKYRTMIEDDLKGYVDSGIIQFFEQFSDKMA